MYNTGAKGAVVEEYFNMVYKLALSQSKNVHTAEDITQTVFLKYLQSKKVFKEKEHIKAWLIRVTLNECKSLYSSPWFKKTVPLEEAEPIAFNNEEKGDVYYATLKLPPKYRAVIHLFYYEDMSVSDIAKTLHQKEAAVKTQLFRGREMLREHLKGGYEDV